MIEDVHSHPQRDCVLQLYSFTHVSCIAICSSVSFTGETVQSYSSISVLSQPSFATSISELMRYLKLPGIWRMPNKEISKACV